MDTEPICEVVELPMRIRRQETIDFGPMLEHVTVLIFGAVLLWRWTMPRPLNDIVTAWLKVKDKHAKALALVHAAHESDVSELREELDAVKANGISDEAAAVIQDIIAESEKE